jgi:RNA polymerase-binding transcription factor DksA
MESLMKAAELNKFKVALLERKRILAGQLSDMEAKALKKGQRANSGDLSNVPFHMADIGSDNFEQEFNLGIIESEGDELRAIDDALQRIEDGTYGLCESCQKKIRKVRLNAIPHARCCIECQREQEQGR